MFDVMEIVKDAQARTLKTMTQGQDTVLKAVKNSVAMVEGFLPALPELPTAGLLPHPKDVATNGFDFAKKVLDSNKKFTTKLIDATSPVLTPVYGPNGNGKAA